MAEGKVPRAALFLAPVQLSHGNFSWLVADILIFFFLAFGQNHLIALRQRGCKHCEEQRSEEQLSCRA